MEQLTTPPVNEVPRSMLNTQKEGTGTITDVWTELEDEAIDYLSDPVNNFSMKRLSLVVGAIEDYNQDGTLTRRCQKQFIFLLPKPILNGLYGLCRKCGLIRHADLYLWAT